MAPSHGEKDPRRRATYEDLRAVPDTRVAEIIDGELVVSPRPGPAHALSASELGGYLLPAYGRRGGGPVGWWILFEPELHLGQHVLVPDLAGWRRARMPQLPRTGYFEPCPDWICEVVSPRTARDDRVRKLDIYARERVEYLWLVDPEAQTLEVYRLAEGTVVRVAAWEGPARVRAEPFPDVEIDLSHLWLPEDEPTP